MDEVIGCTSTIMVSRCIPTVSGSFRVKETAVRFLNGFSGCISPIWVGGSGLSSAHRQSEPVDAVRQPGLVAAFRQSESVDQGTGCTSIIRAGGFRVGGSRLLDQGYWVRIDDQG